MPWTNDQRLFAINYFPDANTAAIVFGGVTNASMPGNPEILSEISSGQIYPGAASLQVLRPVFSFTSFDLQGLWQTGTDNGPGLNGGPLSCVHGDTNPGVELFYAFYECAGPSTDVGSVHRKYTIGEGVLVPTTLTVDHRGNAQMSYDLYVVDKAGTGIPIVKTNVATAALPTHTNNDFRWTMSKMTLPNTGGTPVDVEGKRNITINFNPSVTQAGADSTQFDSVVSVDSFRPQVVVTGVEIDWLTSIATLNGHSVAAAQSIIYLQERTGAAGANDLSISFEGLLSWNNIVAGTPDAPATATLQIDVTELAGGGGFTVDTDATIP